MFDGRETLLRDVTDALATRALFGGGRHLVIVDEADEFVSDNRPALEDYVASSQVRPRCWCWTSSSGPPRPGSTRRWPKAACKSNAGFRRRRGCSNG